ncbi:MAG: hydroxymethylbilane synthase [Pseudomonadota bacterium]
MKIRIGTRKSKLALIQTEMVISELKKNFSELEYEIVPIVTTGDKITNKNLYDIGGKALFLKELEEQLIDKQIDLALHSLKDVPGVVSDKLEIAAVLEREDPRDCFVSFKYKSISELPKGGVIGSSSVRRKVLIAKQRPDLELVQFRGNINTRLQKLKDEEVDATILACAGLVRAGLFDSEFCYPLESEEMLPAAGQGIIALQIRSDDKKIQEICKVINHKPTWYLSQAERSYMTYLDASCRTPMSAYAYYVGDEIKANYMLSDIDGKNIRFVSKICNIDNVNQVGIDAAKELQ